MKTAVVLFNLGGPDSLDAVEPFLRNLFSDPAIISLPNPLRWLVAKLISSRRAKTAQGIYAQIGGKSPLRELTEAQAAALEAQLNTNSGEEYRSFVAMRYWHPISDECARAVKDWAPDRILLVPLYPQFSTTTTGSSLIAWQDATRKIGLDVPNFNLALKSVLRQDPDIILLGEMRDRESFETAISAAETGHLVLGTLHTSNAARTLDRLLDVFPTDQRDQIRIMVSESLRGIVSQQLVPRADGNGRALAIEILMNTPAVGNVIREGKTFMLPGIIQTGKKLGMKLMDDSLIELFQAGIISAEEAVYRAEQKADMMKITGHQ